MYERAVEELIRRFPEDTLPDSHGLRLVDSQRRLPSGRMIDLCFEDDAGTHYVVELKRDRVTPATMRQLLSYLDELKRIDPPRQSVGVLAAPAISPGVRQKAAEQQLRCWAIDEQRLQQIAEREGIGPEQIVRGPRIERDPRSPRPPRVRRSRLSTSDAERVASVQGLNREFQPGTINHRASRETVLAYWEKACPNAPRLHQETAADLTIHCLRGVRGATIQRRAVGTVDPYTVIVNANGIILAAIDARQHWVKLDFLLPLELALQCQSQGLLRIKNARRVGHWVQSKVPKRLTLDRAKQLLNRSFESQFGAVSPAV